MTNIYTITLTGSENIALGYVAESQEQWMNNAIHERCRLAIDEIVILCVKKCMENGIQIPITKELMVELASSEGWLNLPTGRSVLI
jgi:hypothetical protein